MDGTEGNGGGGYRLQVVVHGDGCKKNGVGILINKSLKSRVVDVKRCGDRIILVKQVFGDLVRSVLRGEKLFIGGDLNGQVGASNTVLREGMGALAMALGIKKEKMS
jgi:hypothetical protein